MALQQGTIVSINKTAVGIQVSGTDTVQTVVVSTPAKFDLSKLKIDQEVEFDTSDNTIRPKKAVRAKAQGTGTGAASHNKQQASWS